MLIGGCCSKSVALKRSDRNTGSAVSKKTLSEFFGGDQMGREGFIHEALSLADQSMTNHENVP